MRDGIYYRGSSRLGQPSLEEPDFFDDEEPDAELGSLAETPEGREWAPVDEPIPFATILAHVVAQVQQDEAARAVRMRSAA